MSSNHHTPIPVGSNADAATFNTRYSDLDTAITTLDTRADSFDTTVLEVVAARSGEASLAARFTEEISDRNAAILVETNARIADVTAEEQRAGAAEASLQALVNALSATASTSGGTAFTQLTRLAGAAAISSIGGDGTTTTVVTSAAHGFIDGDFLTISGTTNYNGDTAVIDVVSTTSFTYLSAVNAATETTGFARTKRLFVGSTASFVANQQITITNNAGLLHVTTVSAIPVSGQITLTTAVPTTWLPGGNQASIGNTVSSTLEEIRLARTALNSSGDLSLPAVVAAYGKGVYNVMAYGATGNGSTNDRATIQTAITAGAGQVVEFPSNRTFLIDTTLTIPDNTILYGPGATIKLAGGAHTGITATMLANTLYPATRGTGIQLIGLTFDGNSASQTFAANLQKTMVYLYANKCKVIGCTFKNWDGDGVGLVPNGTGHLIQGCTFDNLVESDPAYGVDGIYSKGADIQIVDNYFTSGGDDTPIVFESVTKGIASGNIIKGTVGQGIAATLDSRDIIIDGNEIEGSTSYGIWIDVLSGAYNDNIKVSRNKIRSSTKHAIFVDDCANVKVIDNEIVESGETGIRVVDTRKVEVKGNTVDSCGENGIAITGTLTTDAQIISNTCRNNSQDGAGSYSGIRVDDADDVLAVANRCYDDQGTKTQEYGIYVASTVTRAQVIANACRSNRNATPISNNATNAINRANDPEVAETHAEIVTMNAGIKISSAGTTMLKKFSGGATLNYPSIAAGAQADLTITVTGAAIGDHATASPSTTLESGINIAAVFVSATNTVTVRLHNTTGGAIDPASRAWRAVVESY